MKIKSGIYKVLLIGLLLPLLLNCKKKPIMTVPAVTITAVTNITESSASSGGEVTSDGGSIINSRGVCWSTKEDPHFMDHKTVDGKGTGNFTSSLTSLSPGAAYYIKAYAVNGEGVGYSNQLTFTTKAMAPVLTTVAPTAILFTTMSSGGEITNDGGAPITARGVCWATIESPTIANSKTTDGTGAGSFTSSITGLAVNTTFYIRAYATNSVGTGYGNQLTAKTRSDVPNLSTSPVAAITQTTATSGGNIAFEGGSAITARGVCWSTSQNPTIDDSKTTNGTGVGSFASSITGLTANTTYYLRAYATNSSVTGYGKEISFKTILLSQVADIDGNVYNTIHIGDQVWLVENLKTTKYRNGDPIAHVPDNAAWGASTTGAYCSPGGNASNDAVYGLIYNWIAVNDSRNIAPAGYHVATNDEWIKLVNYLGGGAGNQLKEAGTVHWPSPNDATNSSGLTVLPAGFRVQDGGFGANFGFSAVYWTSTQDNTASYARIWYCNLGPEIFSYPALQIWGGSVRCIMN